MSPDQQRALLDLGKKLAAGGGRTVAEEEKEPSLVRVERLSAVHARVKVLDAVGVLAVPGLQIVVQPKVPNAHLLYLAERAEVLPRLSETRAELREDETLAHLIARWYVGELERVLRLGLSRDYREVRGEARTVRGRIVPLPTARLFYQGRLRVLSERDEFELDTPLNRVLLAAARAVAASLPLPFEVRRRAHRTVQRMGEVGPVRPGDLRARVDRSTAYYGDALLLARHVLAACGRGLEAGAGTSRGFLFRTAEPVEAGVRAVLRSGLGRGSEVDKKSFPLGPKGMRAHPDVVFGALPAVADVKYKLASERWDRSDLYEVIAFAAAARRGEAAIFDFRRRDVPPLPAVQAGGIQVRQISWRIDRGGPEAAAADFLDRVEEWLGSPRADMGTAGFEPATSRV